MPSTLLVVLFTSVCFTSALGLEGFDPSCQTHHTHGYGYRLFFNLPPSSFQKNGTFKFDFSLSGSSNGHVLLTEKTTPYPAYEFVLGGGGNFFSEVRKYVSSKHEVKINQITKNILSADEIRNFSIRIDQGTLFLFSLNNKTERVILSWEDSEPLDVKYISFCAWTGVSVSWYYDCKGMKQQDQGLSTIRKLRKTLLKGYDPYSIPMHHTDTLMINTSIGLHHVSLDTRKSMLTTHAKFNFSWQDYRIKWNPADYNNITSINLLHREIWLPEFTLHNSVDDGSSPMGKANIMISHNGIVTWRPEAIMKTWCDLQMREWPFDEHYCNVILTLFSHPKSVGISVIQEVLTDVALKNSEWNLKSVFVEKTTIVNSWDTKLFVLKSDELESHKAVLINIDLKRESTYYIYSYFFPIIGSILLTFSSFWLPVFTYKRYLLHSTSFLLVLWNLLSLDLALPSLTNSTPHIMSICCSLLILGTLQIIFSSVVMATLKDQETPPKFVTRIVSNPTIQSLFCLFGDYHEMEDENSLAGDYKANDLNHCALFGVMLDRVMFGFTMIYICIILL